MSSFSNRGKSVLHAWSGKRFKRRTRVKKTIQPVAIVNPPKKNPFGQRISRRAFPAVQTVTMKYAEFTGLSSAAGGAYAEIRFNMNSIFDPDQTGVGHQPYGYDTYSTLYNKYRVLKFSYRIKILNGVQSDASAVNTLVTVVPSQSATSIGSPTLSIEMPRSKFEMVPPGERLILSDTIDLATFDGKKHKEYLSDDIYGAQIGANPTEVMILHVGVSGSAATIATFGIELWYTVELYDPKDLAQS